ncbi:MAG: riboflavin biosynthesis protein RibD, partial [Bacteroidales bacterium]|nr:riboflavin biosynthesis protein RibD [Bacteroidales bacterium]
MQKLIDIKFMKRAIELARQGSGFVNPNPLVGAVIVRDGKIIGEGFHSQ